MPIAHDPPIISAEDVPADGLLPGGFGELYEVHSYRNALHILRNACRVEYDELIGRLAEFRIRTEDIVVAGGNKTKIAKAMDDLLDPLGWKETRILGDLYIRQRIASPGKKAAPPGGVAPYDYVIPGFVDGHKIDFVKGRVAFDVEWNSKDQTFDRDLYAMRTFYDCNIITVGVLLTRSASLAPVFAEIQNRVDIPNFKSKFGASTTWMGKLIYRMNAGRGGGCPILTLGIKPGLISDFEDWKRGHLPKRAESFDIGQEEGQPKEPDPE